MEQSKGLSTPAIVGISLLVICLLIFIIWWFTTDGGKLTEGQNKKDTSKKKDGYDAYCNNNGKKLEGKNGFVCDCKEEYMGNRCQTKRDLVFRVQCGENFQACCIQKGGIGDAEVCGRDALYYPECTSSCEEALHNEEQRENGENCMCNQNYRIQIR